MKKIVLAAMALSLAMPAGVASAEPRHGHPQFKRPPVAAEHMERHHWGAGERLSRQHRKHVIKDYRRYHLRAPGRGQRWVRVDDRFLLMSIANGLIASALAIR